MFDRAWLNSSAVQQLTLRRLIYYTYHKIWSQTGEWGWGRRLEQVLKYIAQHAVVAQGEDYMVGLDDVSFVISELDDADPLLREPFTVSEFVNRLPSKPVVADVGSNHGFYGVMAAVAGCDPVYLFEMSGDVVEGLKENIRSNGVGHRCTVVEKAVWSKNTRVPVETHHVHREEAIGAGEKTMEAITLDSFFAERPDPDIVKIDVEGAEINVLQGMESLLGAAKPVVFVEIHQRVPVGRWGEESTFDAVKHFLQEYGYGITVLDQTGTKNVVNIVAEPRQRRISPTAHPAS